MTWLEVLFWLAVAGLGYVYLGYPLILFLVSRWFPRPVRKAGWEPEVTILIAAFNEERWIRQTIENKLALDYPRERLQLVIVSDGSTDRTADIAATSQGERVMVVQQQPRNGKSAALNLGATHATGEILVFADANSLYQPEALRRLVANFADPSVGYVTGKLRYANPDGTMTGDGCGAYMKYEELRTCERNHTGVRGRRERRHRRRSARSVPTVSSGRPARSGSSPSRRGAGVSGGL